LRRPRHRSHRKGRRDGVRPFETGPKAAADGRDHLKYLREGVHPEKLFDGNRTRGTDPRQVVTDQVYDHDVLGPVLGAARQPAPGGLVGCRLAGKTGGSALYWLRQELVPRLLQVAFGAGAKQVSLPKAVKAGIGVGRSQPERPPRAERIQFHGAGRKFLTKIELITISP